MKSVTMLLGSGLLLLAACQPGSKKLEGTVKDPEMALQIADVYAGQVPCADCEAIDYRLNLKPDFTYESRMIYLGKSEIPFENSGAYGFTTDGILVLERPEPGMNYFKIAPDGSLLMLDLEGQEVTGALADKYKLMRLTRGGKMDLMSEGEGAPNNDFLMKLAGQGIDFYGRGNEPFWAVDMDFDQGFKFYTAAGDSLNTPPVEGAIAQDAPVTRYAAETEAGSVIVTIMKQECTDNMSGEKFTHNVRVEFKKGTDKEYTSYEGCGRYVPDYALAGAWTLTALDGQPVDVANLQKGAPQLTFDPATMRVAGHSSCNNLTGSFEMEKGALVFGHMASTMMACPNMEMERTFNQLISGRMLKYELSENQLVLTHPDGKTLTFAKGE